jgi:hypothetical protein
LQRRLFRMRSESAIVCLIRFIASTTFVEGQKRL